MASQDAQYRDIRATLAVSPDESWVGSSRVVNLPDGRSVTVAVPAGIQDGAEIRMPGLGQVGGPEGKAGDLILRISVVTAKPFENQPLSDPSMPTAELVRPVFPPPNQDRTEYAPWRNDNPPQADMPPGLSPENFAATAPMSRPQFPPSPGEKDYPLSANMPPGLSPENFAATTPMSRPQFPPPSADFQQPPVAPQYQGDQPTILSSSASMPPGLSPQNFAATTPMSRPQFTPPPDAPQYQMGQQITLPPTVPPAAPKRPRSVVVLTVLIVLALVAGSGLIYYIGFYLPSQTQNAATATARAVATNSAQIMQATANAAASSTAQVQGTAQAYQDIYTRITGGTPTLNDGMGSQTGSQWEVLTSSAKGTCGFSGGAYHSVMPVAGLFQPCFATNTHFSNFAFQVNMTIVSGDEGGILFRADEANYKFYLFNISSTGDYNLYLYVSTQGTQATKLLSGNTNLFKSAGQSNEITLIAQGSSLLFYLNQHYLVGVTESTYSAGMIGVFGESKAQTTDVAFSNIKVWAL